MTSRTGGHARILGAVLLLALAVAYLRSGDDATTEAVRPAVGAATVEADPIPDSARDGREAIPPPPRSDRLLALVREALFDPAKGRAAHREIRRALEDARQVSPLAVRDSAAGVLAGDVARAGSEAELRNPTIAFALVTLGGACDPDLRGEHLREYLRIPTQDPEHLLLRRLLSGLPLTEAQCREIDDAFERLVEAPPHAIYAELVALAGRDPASAFTLASRLFVAAMRRQGAQAAAIACALFDALPSPETLQHLGSMLAVWETTQSGDLDGCLLPYSKLGTSLRLRHAGAALGFGGSLDAADLHRQAEALLAASADPALAGRFAESIAIALPAIAPEHHPAAVRALSRLATGAAGEWTRQTALVNLGALGRAADLIAVAGAIRPTGDPRLDSSRAGDLLAALSNCAQRHPEDRAILVDHWRRCLAPTASDLAPSQVHAIQLLDLDSIRQLRRDLQSLVQDSSRPTVAAAARAALAKLTAPDRK
jgi:hypothetical protein